MNIAQVVASRSTCPRKFVGSVIVRDRTILSTGYNGSIRGMPHCSDVGHMMEDDHCVATIHAEANAIIQAAKNGVMIDGATIYVTASPCWNCFKQIANAGIRRIVYGEFYRDDRIFRSPSGSASSWSTSRATSRSPRADPRIQGGQLVGPASSPAVRLLTAPCGEGPSSPESKCSKQAYKLF